MIEHLAPKERPRGFSACYRLTSKLAKRTHQQKSFSRQRQDQANTKDFKTRSCFKMVRILRQTMTILDRQNAQALANEQNKNIIIPEFYTSVAKNAFQNLELKSIAIPDSITSIGDYAFAYNEL